MKKLFLVMVIGAFVACNDNADIDENANDTLPATTVPVDTNTVAPLDTTGVQPIDTSAAVN